VLGCGVLCVGFFESTNHSEFALVLVKFDEGQCESENKIGDHDAQLWKSSSSS
jgi:hypothetical protein